MPLDLFTCTRENFFNYLVCRTGGAESNIKICEAARARGWKWNPYGNGFSRPASTHFASNGETIQTPDVHTVTSECEVFEFVGLPYLEPWKR
jgi:DNA polymerase/3'-5' exonuclease PolX